jgi:hypothetical protein
MFFYSKELRPFELYSSGTTWMFATGGLRFEFPQWGHDRNTEEPWEAHTSTDRGTATVTYARSFPARYPKMCVYAALTGLHGHTKFTALDDV